MRCDVWIFAGLALASCSKLPSIGDIRGVQDGGHELPGSLPASAIDGRTDFLPPIYLQSSQFAQLAVKIASHVQGEFDLRIGDDGHRPFNETITLPSGSQVRAPGVWLHDNNSTELMIELFPYHSRSDLGLTLGSSNLVAVTYKAQAGDISEARGSIEVRDFDAFAFTSTSSPMMTNGSVGWMSSFAEVGVPGLVDANSPAVFFVQGGDF